jgi:hypothetical protein
MRLHVHLLGAQGLLGGGLQLLGAQQLAGLAGLAGGLEHGLGGGLSLGLRWDGRVERQQG